MHPNRRQTLQWLAAATAGAALPGLATGAATPLKTIAAAKGMRCGNALGYGHRKAAYLALMARECDTLVAENETKWQALQPRPGQFDFARADVLFDWARAQGMAVRGHTLVWQPAKWLPDWVNKHAFGANGVREAERLLTSHIGTVCRHFGNGIYSWDVVNEAVDPDTGGMRSNVFTERLGAIEQVDLCFRLAREEMPATQLVYNDYMRWDEGSAKHRAGVLKMLQALKKRGTPVQALGIQGHIGSWDDSRSASHELVHWRRFLDEVTGMGLDLLVTEFDVNDRKLPADIAARDAGVAALARDFLDVTFSYPQCRDFLLWGLSDDNSWLQTWHEAPRSDKLPMRPCPYDAQLRAKPLREAIAGAMRAMPPRRAA
jgi:endo-1,4-beta-xylanase